MGPRIGKSLLPLKSLWNINTERTLKVGSVSFTDRRLEEQKLSLAKGHRGRGGAVDSLRSRTLYLLASLPETLSSYLNRLLCKELFWEIFVKRPINGLRKEIIVP